MMNSLRKFFPEFSAALLKAVLFITTFSLPMADGAELKAADVSPVILFVGDSHSVGSFGMQQDALLRKVKGFHVATYAVCGSSPLSWFLGDRTSCGFFFRDTEGREQRGLDANNPLLAKLISAHQPRYTVVELGANMYGWPIELIEQASHAMAMAIVNSGSKCIWIGPPQARNQPEPELGRVFEALRSSVGQYCLLFDSRNFTSYPAVGGDGIHFNSLGEPGQRIAEKWALSAFYAFSPVLAMDKPVK